MARGARHIYPGRNNVMKLNLGHLLILALVLGAGWYLYRRYAK